MNLKVGDIIILRRSKHIGYINRFENEKIYIVFSIGTFFVFKHEIEIVNKMFREEE